MQHQAAEISSHDPVGENSECQPEIQRHDFGADLMIELAAQTVAEAERISDLRRAEKIMANAGVLAAKEALSYGYEIVGWDGDLDRLPRWTDDKAVEDEEGGMFINWELSQLQELPDRYQILANKAENYELRRIRQTGSNLIMPYREIRFALARVERARRTLAKEEAELKRLEEELAPER